MTQHHPPGSSLTACIASGMGTQTHRPGERAAVGTEGDPGLEPGKKAPCMRSGAPGARKPTWQKQPPRWGLSIPGQAGRCQQMAGLMPGSRARKQAAACGLAKGCAPPGKAAAKAGRGDAARDDRPDTAAVPAEGKDTHSLPGSRLLPVRWKDQLASLCRKTLNRTAQCMKSPDFSHYLPSRVPSVDKSFLRTCKFRKHFLAPPSAHLC